MKTSPLGQRILNALAVRAAAAAEILADEALESSTDTQLAALAGAADLRDPKASAEIAHLLTIKGIMPVRKPIKEQALSAATEAIIPVCHDFISEQFGPLLRRITVETRKRVQSALSPHFSNEAALAQAVELSPQMTALREIDFAATITNPTDPETIVTYAERLLKGDADIQKLAAAA